MKRQNRNCIINGKEFYYTESVKEQASVRKSFNELADKTFGLSFENWYRLGYWRDAYIPHVLLDQIYRLMLSIRYLKTGRKDISKSERS